MKKLCLFGLILVAVAGSIIAKGYRNQYYLHLTVVQSATFDVPLINEPITYRGQTYYTDSTATVILPIPIYTDCTPTFGEMIRMVYLRANNQPIEITVGNKIYRLKKQWRKYDGPGEPTIRKEKLVILSVF